MVEKVVLQKSIKDITFTKIIFWNTNNGKLHPKVKMYCDYTDCLYDPEIDENGFYIYTLPIDDVRLKLRDKSDRYRLYGMDTIPVDIQKSTPSGRNIWQKHYPYIYKKVHKVVDPTAEVHEFEDKFEWIELTPETKNKINFEQQCEAEKKK